MIRSLLSCSRHTSFLLLSTGHLKGSKRSVACVKEEIRSDRLNMRHMLASSEEVLFLPEEGKKCQHMLHDSFLKNDQEKTSKETPTLLSLNGRFLELIS